MIDLHLHTTASDGRLSPAELVQRVAAAGIRTMSVTDHDTVAGLAEARAAAVRVDLEMVDGIEITAVHEGRDVHILGYYIDTTGPALSTFLRAQRASRVERVFEIGEKLNALGVGIDIDDLLESAAARAGRIGRAAINRAGDGRRGSRDVGAGRVRSLPRARAARVRAAARADVRATSSK